MFEPNPVFSISGPNPVVILHNINTPLSTTFRNCIVWVIRNTSKAPQLGQLEAVVMERANESDVRDIYRKFLEVGPNFAIFWTIVSSPLL